MKGLDIGTVILVMPILASLLVGITQQIYGLLIPCVLLSGLAVWREVKIRQIQGGKG